MAMGEPPNDDAALAWGQSLQPGENGVTGAHWDAVWDAAIERRETQLSTAPVDEAAAEAWLRAAYAAAGLPAPERVHWLDGPLELVAILADGLPSLPTPQRLRDRVPRHVWDDALGERDELALLKHGARPRVDSRVRGVAQRAEQEVNALLDARMGQKERDWFRGRDRSPITRILTEAARNNVADSIWRALGETLGRPLPPRIREQRWGRAQFSLWQSVSAYDDAPLLAELLFYDTHLAANPAGALARFNACVSGYWLGARVALLVRRPLTLARDERQRLHSADGPCVEYRDGWRFWAWHGVQVPERIIREPESLTRDDFLNERNVEARRVIQERMGDRFFAEIRARQIDQGARGTLYEVDLPGEIEELARYVQVLDPSTGRVYYLRVPPTVSTAQEAVAWTFGLSRWEYAPQQEA